MGEVPLFEELVSNGTPSIRSGGATHHLVKVFVDDGLTDFSDEE
jgi:hypothetical protein